MKNQEEVKERKGYLNKHELKIQKYKNKNFERQ